ncbi:hypothetical protein LUZ60_004497 [Juncus effusus]|nr:hypothetical protein LUZ60_004497 [Juncus effusus]
MFVFTSKLGADKTDKIKNCSFNLIMDPWLSYSFLFFSFFLSILFLKLRTSKPSLRLPPGPWRLPLIGNLHNLIGSLPHHAMRDLYLKFGPVILLQLGETPTVIVSSPETAREIFKTHDITFATRPISPTIHIFTQGGKGIIFPPYGEYWRQLRKICITEVLSTKRVQSFRSVREEEVNNIIGYISSCSRNGKIINLSERLLIMINDSTIKAVIGSKCEGQDVYLHELEKSVKIVAGSNLVDLFPSSSIANLISGAKREAQRCQQAMARIIHRAIEQHRERKASEQNGETEGLVDILLRIHDEGTLGSTFDIDSVRAVVHDIFAAGSETSSTTLEWAMSELIRNPRVMKKAQSEIRELLKGCTTVSELDIVKLKYLHLVIKETLRLHPPAPLLVPRQCQETCRISGYDIPEGVTVLVNVWAIGRDPKYWEDPEEFKPERFIDNNVDFKGTDFEFIPFGSGRRMCPGMAFGLANVELPLASLLYHFDWKLPDCGEPKEIDMSESVGITVRRKTPLKLLAVPYNLMSE